MTSHPCDIHTHVSQRAHPAMHQPPIRQSDSQAQVRDANVSFQDKKKKSKKHTLNQLGSLTVISHSRSQLLCNRNLKTNYDGTICSCLCVQMILSFIQWCEVVRLNSCQTPRCNVFCQLFAAPLCLVFPKHLQHYFLVSRRILIT